VVDGPGGMRAAPDGSAAVAPLDSTTGEGS
jgi:hypothetical protein